jgi:glycosyltransferase involved in cell wall biosynthesis
MKGHATIIDALPQIQEKIPDIKCLFVGGEFVNEKWYQEELYRYVQENHLENTIIFTGFRRDIPELLSLFDVFVLPSLWEGLPSSILEAMAMKKPVIASSVGGIPEVVKHEETGVLIPPQDSKALADAIIFLLNNPDIAVKIGQAGYNRVQDFFSIESVVARIESVYARLIEKNCVDISKEENRK